MQYVVLQEGHYPFDNSYKDLADAEQEAKTMVEDLGEIGTKVFIYFPVRKVKAGKSEYAGPRHISISDDTFIVGMDIPRFVSKKDATLYADEFVSENQKAVCYVCEVFETLTVELNHHY